jgi:hypothetical protein
MEKTAAYSVPQLPDPLLTQAYDKAASHNVLAALNDQVFFGYFSVCADGKGHGGDTTFPGLDWGQSAEALLWLGRDDIVRASWDYVKSFQREDGLLPFAILPGHADTTFLILGSPIRIEKNGAAYVHWEPGNPFRTLALVTYIQVANAFFRHTGDEAWLRNQADSLRLALRWLERTVNERGLVVGGGYYLERPPRHEHDGVAQCYNAHAYGLAAALFEHIGDAAEGMRCRRLADRITTAFRSQFWDGSQCFEYIDPKGNRIPGHGLTDVDWIAVATHTASPDQVKAVWPRLREAKGFIYSGLPTGIATKPETYADWEITSDRHDIAAMGRVWYLEAWARAEMGDGDGLAASLRQVAESGRGNDWSWFERYYSESTGFLGLFKMNRYVEYPACLIRIVNRFLLGIEYGLDGSLRLAPTVPENFWKEGFGQALSWANRTLEFRFRDGSLTGTYTGLQAQPVHARLHPSAMKGSLAARVNGQNVRFTAKDGWVEFDLPPSPQPSSFELTC